MRNDFIGMLLSRKRSTLAVITERLSLFRALVTATNEVGEIRIQFHVVTDGHDQMQRTIEAFNDTSSQYGQPPTSLLFTDKPSEDKKFFFSMFPGLHTMQAAFDKATASFSTPSVDSEKDGELPAVCTVDARSNVEFLKVLRN